MCGWKLARNQVQSEGAAEVKGFCPNNSEPPHAKACGGFFYAARGFAKQNALIV
jgi:hypothetical protein